MEHKSNSVKQLFMFGFDTLTEVVKAFEFSENIANISCYCTDFPEIAIKLHILALVLSLPFSLYKM